MKYSITAVLIALIVLNILDGDFANPSALDYAKFVLLAICIILNIRQFKAKE